MRNLHNVDRRSNFQRGAFMSGHPYIIYGTRDNFYCKRGDDRSDWIARGFTKGTMSETHFLRAKTLTALSERIAAEF